MKNKLSLFLLYLVCAPFLLRANLPCGGGGCTSECTCQAHNGGGPDGPSGGGPSGGGPGGGGPLPLPPIYFVTSLIPASGHVAVDSLSLTVNFGASAGEWLNLIGQFSVYSKTPSASVFTPQFLQYRNRLLDRIAQRDLSPAHAASILRPSEKFF